MIWLLALACAPDAPDAPVAGSGTTSDWEGVPAVFDFDLTIDGDVTWVGSTSLFAIESSGNCTTSWSLAARSTHMRGGNLVLQVTGTDLLDMGTELAPFDERISAPGGHVDTPS